MYLLSKGKTQGVKLINVSDDEKLVAVQSIERIDDLEDESEEIDEEV